MEGIEGIINNNGTTDDAFNLFMLVSERTGKRLERRDETNFTVSKNKVVYLNNGETYIFYAKPDKSGHHRVNVIEQDSINSFLVKDNEVLIKINKDLILQYLKNFLKKRKFNVSRTNRVKTKRSFYGDMQLEGIENKVGFNIKEKKEGWDAILFDRVINVICSEGHHYFFPFRNYGSFIKNKDGFEIDYESMLRSKGYHELESDFNGTSFLAKIRKMIYGFGSRNLRIFYGHSGVIPEMKYFIKQADWGIFSKALLETSILTRITGRLKEKSWYTILISGLAILRIGGEMYYLDKALKVSEHMPTALQSNISKQEKFKLVYESRDIRAWRNFEDTLFRITKTNGEFYETKKGDLYNGFTGCGSLEQRLNLFRTELNLTNEQISKLKPYIELLIPLDLETHSSIINQRINKIREGGIFNENSIDNLIDYINRTHAINLTSKSISHSNQLLAQEITHSIRMPTKEESHKLLVNSRKHLIKNIWIEFLLFMTNYVAGYSASYTPTPNFAYPIYYLATGAAASFNKAGITRLDLQINLQYLLQELRKDPTVSSAEDTWNEYRSHIKKSKSIFMPLGIALGVIGKLLSPYTAEVSQFTAEAFAFYGKAMSVRNWNKGMKGLIERCKNNNLT